MITIQNIRGLFLILLSVLAGFFIPSMSCQVQRILKSSYLVRYVVLFCLTYFTINFTSSQDEPPVEQLRDTIYLVLFFILFNRMDLNFTAIVFLGLTIILFIDNWIEYNTKQINENEEMSQIEQKEHKIKLEQLRKWKSGITYSIYALIIVGVTMYATRKASEKRDFSFMKFFLGKHC